MAIAALVPWKDILRVLPTVVVTAKDLWQYWASRPKAAPVDPREDVKTQIASLSERLAALEAAEAAQARLASQIAEQLQGIARRAAVGYWLGVGGLLVAFAALFLAASR